MKYLSKCTQLHPAARICRYTTYDRIRDAHAHQRTREQIITLRDSLKYSLSHQSPSLHHPLPPLLYSFPLPSNTTQNIDTSLSSLSVSLSLHHSLTLLNTDRLSTPWPEFQISPTLSMLLSLHPLQKNSSIKVEKAEVNALR